MNPELDLLRVASRTTHDEASAARLRHGCGGVRSWVDVMYAARDHGTLGLLYTSLRGVCPEAVPLEVTNVLAQQTTLLAARALRQLSELDDALTALRNARIEAVPFKGPVLASAAYGNTSLRRSADLDLLIHDRDRERAFDVMEGLGFQLETPVDREGRPTEPGKYEYHFEKEGSTAVELRWRVTQQLFQASLDLDYVLPRCRPATLQGMEYLAIAPEDLLLILCAHGAKHVWARLGWLCDLAELIRAHRDLDWPEVWRRAEELGLRRLTRFSLILAADVLGAPVPDEYLNVAREDAVAAGLAENLRRRFVDGERRATNPEYHLLILDDADRRRHDHSTSAKPRFRWRKNSPPSTNTLIE